MKKQIGQHIILDINNVNFGKIKKLTQKNIISRIKLILKNNNFTVLSNNFYFFGNNIESFTGVFLLSESHFSIHTWPEIGFVAIDFFSCNFINNNNLNIDIALDEILSLLFSKNIIIDKKIINR